MRPKEQCTAAALRAEVGDVDTVTHVGRLADETDRNAWRTMTGAAAKAAAGASSRAAPLEVASLRRADTVE